MRFRLRTLLIVLAIGPPLLAATCVAIYAIREEMHIRWLEGNDPEGFKALGPHPPQSNP